MAIDVNGHCVTLPGVSLPLHVPTDHPPALSFHIDLPLGEQAASLARRTVAGVLRSWRMLDEDWNYDVQLLCSELVGNAVRHGGQRVALALALGRAQLTVEVSDGSCVVPERREVAGQESGRGLTIIDVLADRWGVRSYADGKTVWATMTVPQVPAQRRAGSAEGRRAAS